MVGCFGLIAFTRISPDIVMSAGLTVLLVDDEPQRTTLSREGEYVIVPRNTWHTAATSVPTRMLFVTPGEGTLNRAR